MKLRPLLVLVLCLLTACTPSTTAPPSSPPSASSLAEAQNHTLGDNPFFTLSFDGIDQIDYEDAAMGERDSATDAATIAAAIETIKAIPFVATPPDPATIQAAESLSNKSFYLCDFYDRTISDTPLFTISLDPLFVVVNGQTFGPYRTTAPDGDFSALYQLLSFGLRSSEEELLSEAEQVLSDFYKPMLPRFPNRIDFETPLSPDIAYDCFQYYALAERSRAESSYKRWVSWLTEGEEQPLGLAQHYRADIVEPFISTYFHCPATELQTLPLYDPELDAYELSIWAGTKDLSTLQILDRRCEGAFCTFTCLYDSGHGQRGNCTITLRKTNDGFSI